MELAWPKGEGAQCSTKETSAITSSSSQFCTHSDPPFPPATCIVTKCYTNDSNEGFFIRRTAETEPFGAKNRAEFGSVGRGRDERFCFGGCWKAKREEEEKKFSFYCRGIFLTEFSAIGAIAEDFWCFNSPSSYPEQVGSQIGSSDTDVFMTWL